MSGYPDINKRKIMLRLRIETVTKVEKKATENHRFYTDEICAILEDATRDVVLTAEDYRKIAEEVKQNEISRKSKKN